MAGTTVKSLAALLIGTAILILGQGLMLALVPLSMNARGFSVTAVSLVGAAYFAGFFAGAWRGDAILRSVGHIRAYGGLVALIIVAVLSLPFFSEAAIWVVLRFLHGFAAGGAFLAIEAWLNGAADEKSRGRVLASYMVVTLGGLGAAQFLADVGDITTTTPFIVGGILFAASIIPVVLTRIDVPPIDTAVGTPLSEVYQRSPFGVVTSFAVGMSIGAFWTLGPFFASEMELSVSQASTLMATAVFAGLLLQWPAGYFSDRYDRRLVAVVIAGTAGAAAIIAIVFMGIVGIPLIYVFFAVLGSQFCLYPIAMAHAVDQVQGRNESLGVARGLIMSNGLGQTIGPLLAGPFVALFEPRGLLIYFAVILGGIALFTRRRMKVGAHVTASQQGAYIFARSTTPAGAELNPRIDDDVSDHEGEHGSDTEERKKPGQIRDGGQDDGG